MFSYSRLTDEEKKSYLAAYAAYAAMQIAELTIAHATFHDEIVEGVLLKDFDTAREADAVIAKIVTNLAKPAPNLGLLMAHALTFLGVALVANARAEAAEAIANIHEKGQNA